MAERSPLAVIGTVTVTAGSAVDTVGPIGGGRAPRRGAVAQAVAEREPRRDPAVLVAAVADVETLLVALHRLAVHAFGGALVLPRRMVVETDRDRQRQPPAGIGHPEQHVDERFGLFLTGEERRQDRRRTRRRRSPSPS